MNRNFGKLIDGKVQYAPNNLTLNGVTYAAPTDEKYLAAGWKSIIDERPPYREGYTIVDDCWEDGILFLTRKYRYELIHHTEADFNAALEQHLRDERTARGYDEREPSDYKDSGIARWRQDALDWIAHRDAVMMYGLNILNEWKKTKVEPDYAAFVTGLPKIVWTIQDEPNTEEV